MGCGRSVGYCRGDDEWLDLLELVLHDVSSEGCAAAAASIETAILTATGRSDGRAGGWGWRAGKESLWVLLGEGLRRLTTRASIQHEGAERPLKLDSRGGRSV
jgi:hypothetical protein